MTSSRKSELAWAIVRYAVGLPLLVAEVGLAGAFVTWFVKCSTFRDHVTLGCLAAFFGVQAWVIWRVLLSPGHSGRSRRKLIESLEAIDPLSQEFYSNSAGYFWQRARSMRNYGRFFVLLAVVSVALVFVHWQSRSLVLSLLPGYLFFGFVGLLTIDGALKTSGVLTHADRESDGVTRMRLLRQVALRYRGDPVAVRILRITNEAQPG